jgi:hypothetical protein
MLPKAVRPRLPGPVYLGLDCLGAVKSPQETALHTNFSKTCPNHFEHLPNAPRCPNHVQTPPPLIDNACIKAKIENIEPKASQKDKIQHKMLHMSK